jgi:hypothetical protein
MAPPPWEVDVLDGWLEQLRRPEFAQHVHTYHKTVAEVADLISRTAGLTITPATDGPLRTPVAPVRNNCPLRTLAFQ